MLQSAIKRGSLWNRSLHNICAAFLSIVSSTCSWGHLQTSVGETEADCPAVAVGLTAKREGGQDSWEKQQYLLSGKTCAFPLEPSCFNSHLPPFRRLSTIPLSNLYLSASTAAFQARSWSNSPGPFSWAASCQIYHSSPFWPGQMKIGALEEGVTSSCTPVRNCFASFLFTFKGRQMLRTVLAKHYGRVAPFHSVRYETKGHGAGRGGRLLEIK